jgi:hypothetical protein
VCLDLGLEPRLAFVLVVVFVLDVVRQFSGNQGIHSARNNLVGGANPAIELTPTMNGTEQAIMQVLVELDAAVETMPAANPKPDLRPLFDRIDELTWQLPRDADPNLLHYLHKKSYEKARLFLQGREEENQRGDCRHVN